MAGLNYIPPPGGRRAAGRSMPGESLLKATDFAPGAFLCHPHPRDGQVDPPEGGRQSIFGTEKHWSQNESPQRPLSGMIPPILQSKWNSSIQAFAWLFGFKGACAGFEGSLREIRRRHPQGYGISVRP